MKKSQSTYAGLAQEIGFSPANVLSLLKLIKTVAKLCAPAREECNKYDLTAAVPCF
jgi:hypothetical protein